MWRREAGKEFVEGDQVAGFWWNREAKSEVCEREEACNRRLVIVFNDESSGIFAFQGWMIVVCLKRHQIYRIWDCSRRLIWQDSHRISALAFRAPKAMEKIKHRN